MPGVESRSAGCSSPCHGRYGRRPIVSTTGHSGSTATEARARDNRFDDLCLGVRVVLDVLPPPLDEMAFRSLVEVAVVVMGPQPVAKPDHPLELHAAVREDVEVDVRVGTLEDAVVVPVRLALADPHLV